MSLIQEIKDQNLAARRSKFTAVSNLLTTLIGEAEMVGKNAGREVSDAEVLAVIRKFVKNINETISILGDNDLRTTIALAERQTLEVFLPRQLGTDELEQIISSIKVELAAGPKDMGRVLALLKSRFDGQYDGKSASMIAKVLLS